MACSEGAAARFGREIHARGAAANGKIIESIAPIVRSRTDVFKGERETVRSEILVAKYKGAIAAHAWNSSTQVICWWVYSAHRDDGRAAANGKW